MLALLPSRRLLKTIVMGQVLSLLICGTAISCQYLANDVVETPMLQSFLNYALLLLVYMTMLILRKGLSNLTFTLFLLVCKQGQRCAAFHVAKQAKTGMQNTKFREHCLPLQLMDFNNIPPKKAVFVSVELNVLLFQVTGASFRF